ncbi:MAG: 16S rRNA (guanine(527)-N(7))-methyltransferase RsmG [Muribaculaceae bacterium]|nr:16S rRNA (guanine(527)-N(7))-methyltransferase RsmG [Muribaculaceae bacterium]
MDEILRYFPELDERQREQVDAMLRLYPEWNERINVVSRKDIDNLAVHHILHSMAIAKFLTPAPGTRFMDLGTGGGFPGIPLAMMWPESRFLLLDRIAKKLRVAEAVAAEMGLTNVRFMHGDSGECHEKFDYVVSRAVMPLADLVKACAKNIAPTASPSGLPNGIVCLKGGDLKDEIEAARRPVLEVPLSDYFAEAYFQTKSLLYVKI